MFIQKVFQTLDFIKSLESIERRGKQGEVVFTNDCACTTYLFIFLSSISSFDAVPKRIVNVETFVERIIQETIFEAFQEYCVLRSQGKGVVNLGYQKIDDEDVVLRKKPLPVSKQPTKTHCLHKKHVQKVS